MDMDARGGEDEATSNKNGQGGNVTKNGVEGMQELNEQMGEIDIGSLKVPLSPTGNTCSISNAVQKNIAANSILHDSNQSLKNKNCADSNADSGSVLFSSGLLRGRTSGAHAGGPSADSASSTGAKPSGRPEKPLAMQSSNGAPPLVMQQGSADVRTGAGKGSANRELGFAETQAGELSVVSTGSTAAQSGGRPGQSRVVLSIVTSPLGQQQDGAAVKADAGTCSPNPKLGDDCRPCSVRTKAGSAVAMQSDSRKPGSSAAPQKIPPTPHSVAPAVRGVYANHEAMMVSFEENLGGSGIVGNGMAFGVSSVCPNFNLGTFVSTNLSLQTDDKRCSTFHTKGEKSGMNLQNTMRDASCMKANGEIPLHVDCSTKNNILPCALSLVENDSVSLCPSIEDVIAFGGIPKPISTGRSSTRLGGQPNADMPQMEKAMKMASLRDESPTSSKFTIPRHSIINISDSEIVRRADRLGISLGKSAGEIDKSVKGIKMVEEERILTILEKKNNDNENMKEGLETFVLSKVSNLCQDLVDEDDTNFELDDHIEHLKPVVKVKKNRQRKIYDTNNIRKSTRKRIKKQW
jgi:hypothetical protein